LQEHECLSSTAEGLTIEPVDYHNTRQVQDMLWLLNEYAQDPMGGGEPLRDDVKQGLAEALAERPYAFSLLCYVDGEPAGLLNGFEGFSTFRCQPLLNIHDIVVVNAFRGQGISQQLLAQVESMARAKGCCKITLEVLEGNTVAQQAYRRFGFAGYELDPQMGKALFWQKELA